jgi:four helix bundle protein
MYTSLGQKKLEVYQQSPEFITWRLPLLDTLSAGASVRNQLDRASISVPLNIAEGKFTSADRCRFFDNARASALECAPGLDVMIAKQFVETNGVEKGNNMSIRCSQCCLDQSVLNRMCAFSNRLRNPEAAWNRNKSKIKNRKFLSC